MQSKNKYLNIYLAILSGCLLGFSWPDIGNLTLLSFVGYVPLLLLEHRIYLRKGQKHQSGKIFWLAWLAFLIFNLITTWWIYYASPGGMIMAVIFNSLFMAITFRLFHTVHKKFGNQIGYIAFVVLWLGFEYLHLNWELSWPWLTIGNVFAVKHQWVQWYAFTGILGGSLWVLLANVFLFFVVKDLLKKERKKLTKNIIASLLIIIFPMAISYIIYFNYQATGKEVNVTVVQPNVDPYNEKFDTPDSVQLQQFLNLAKSKTTDSTAFIIGPETALPGGYWEDQLEQAKVVKMLRKFLKNYPRCRFIIGLSSYKVYPQGTPHPNTARKLPNNPGYYFDAYNSSMEIDNEDSIQIYHKSRLVLGVEKIPFAGLLKPLGKLAINLGGTVGSLGTQKHASDFKALNNSLWYQGKVGTLVCYESVYGAYSSEFVKRGAGILFIITNDGWWKNTPGYKQHFDYARLAAISLRRSIAQSANTGRSGFFNQRGDSFNTTKWWVPTAINGKIRENSAITFYARFGDYIGVIASIISILLLLGIIEKNLFKKLENKKT